MWGNIEMAAKVVWNKDEYLFMVFTISDACLPVVEECGHVATILAIATNFTFLFAVS